VIRLQSVDPIGRHHIEGSALRLCNGLRRWRVSYPAFPLRADSGGLRNPYIRLAVIGMVLAIRMPSPWSLPSTHKWWAVYEYTKPAWWYSKELSPTPRWLVRCIQELAANQSHNRRRDDVINTPGCSRLLAIPAWDANADWRRPFHLVSTSGVPVDSRCELPSLPSRSRVLTWAPTCQRWAFRRSYCSIHSQDWRRCRLHFLGGVLWSWRREVEALRDRLRLGRQ